MQISFVVVIFQGGKSLRGKVPPAPSCGKKSASAMKYEQITLSYLLSVLGYNIHLPE